MNPPLFLFFDSLNFLRFLKKEHLKQGCSHQETNDQ